MFVFLVLIFLPRSFVFYILLFRSHSFEGCTSILISLYGMKLGNLKYVAVLKLSNDQSWFQLISNSV